MQTQTDPMKINRKSFARAILPAILALIFFSACNDNIVFEENHSVNSRGWHINDTLIFNYTVKDTTALYDLYINVRNNTEFPYSNFYVFFETQFPDGRVFRDTVEMMLADRFGNWTGRGFGNIKSNSFHFRRDVWFPLEGGYTFAVQHAMREEAIKGISDMGIRIEKK
jgi:gliding motility-associated lipoprotein GldH